MSRTSKSERLHQLARLSEVHPDLAPYLTREMAVRAHRYIKGVKLYQGHAAKRCPENSKVIWQSGSTVLRDFAPGLANAPVILVVPSLINRFAILDLAPGHSFVGALRAHGLRPLVVDWESPGTSESEFSLGDYIMERLVPALHVAGAGQPVHILGYCMGGLLALALATRCPAQTKTLSLLATPWDFHAGYDAQGVDGRDLEGRLAAWLGSDALVPIDVLQSVFSSFQPFHAMRKFSVFGDTEQTGADASLFVLTEDWLNDGVPLSVRAARECFGDLGCRNAAAKGNWRVREKSVSPSDIRVPSYVVVPGKDQLVPPQSAAPLASALHGAVRQDPSLGHIGIMASPSAPQKVWIPLAEWLCTN